MADDDQDGIFGIPHGIVSSRDELMALIGSLGAGVVGWVYFPQILHPSRPLWLVGVLVGLFMVTTYDRLEANID